MKKLSTRKILLIVFLWLIASVFGYTYLTFCVQDGDAKDFFSELSLSFINGLCLAMAVFIFGVFIEEARSRELKKEKSNQKLITLTNLINRTFKRSKSSWNFSNKTPTFYFDNEWINPLYSLLTQNNREWDVFIQEYKKDFDRNALIEELNSFIEEAELALINAETLDSTFLAQKVSPSLAANMRSGYVADRNGAKENAEFDYWVTRATWAGASTAEIMFSFPLFTNQRLIFERIDGISNEAKTLELDVYFKDLINKLKNDRKNLNKKISAIRKYAAS